MAASSRPSCAGATAEGHRDPGVSQPPGAGDPLQLAEQILIRADSHYACPEVIDWCEANGLDYVFGLAPTRTLKRHVIGLEDSTSSRFSAAPAAGKLYRSVGEADAEG